MRNKRLKRLLIKYSIIFSVTAVVMISLIITNIFIPIKYLGAYVHFTSDKNEEGAMRIRFVDVGYGDCTVVELPDGKTMLIDGGKGTYSDVHNILKILNLSNIDKIDYLICTSVKSEHCGGLAELVKYKPVGTAYIPFVANIYMTDEYAEFYNQLLKSGAQIEVAEYGEGVYSKEYSYWFGILSPAVHLLPQSEYNVMNSEPTPGNINNASCVFWLQYAGKGILFLSDVGTSVQGKVERAMRVENRVFNLNGEIVEMGECIAIKSANHCGLNSVSATLYDFLQPKAAIITIGENAQNSPSLEDIAILQLYVGNNLYRTDINGMITIKVNEENFFIDREIV